MVLQASVPVRRSNALAVSLHSNRVPISSLSSSDSSSTAAATRAAHSPGSGQSQSTSVSGSTALPVSFAISSSEQRFRSTDQIGDGRVSLHFVRVKEAERVTLTCNTTQPTKPETKLFWLLNGHPLPSGTLFNFSSLSFLSHFNSFELDES
jgi:hypothetical protein